MSRASRCHACAHTAGPRDTFAQKCACDCHAPIAPHAQYGPTPVQRPPWPKAGGPALLRVEGRLKVVPRRGQVQLPLVVR